jgi:hypothetical protein
MIAGYASVLRDLFCYVPHDVVVPGALTAGDLPDIAAALAPRPLRIETLVDGRNCQLTPEQSREFFDPTIRAYRSSKGKLLLADPTGKDIATWLANSLMLRAPGRSSKRKAGA